MAEKQTPMDLAETVSASASVRSAAERMRDAGVGALSVTDGARARGFITDRDLVVQVMAEGRDPALTLVADLIPAQEEQPAADARMPVGPGEQGRTARHEYGWRSSRPHPWHGLAVGPSPPNLVHAYVEITPFDLVKYELDKQSGCLVIDRPQLLSSLPPTVYGFIPRTLCGASVAGLLPGVDAGDGDPLDVCVLSERSILRGEVLLRVHVVGGLSTIDAGRADDKIVAVLAHDPVWGDVDDINELPAALVARLKHYFGSYKAQPGHDSPSTVASEYGAAHARQVVIAAMEDYVRAFGDHGASQGAGNDEG